MAPASAEQAVASQPAANRLVQSQPVRVTIACDTDIVAARQTGRELAASLGLSSGDATIVSTAISELARNIVRYGVRGEVTIAAVARGDDLGITVVARDEGPGIPNLQQAMQDGFSTSGGLGLGLPGIKRLMDEFEIVSGVGQGTAVTVTKWKR